jgi:hypothetical protein
MRAYRLKQETIWEIERLAEEWQCTHAEVLERAIDRVDGASDSAERPRGKQN